MQGNLRFPTRVFRSISLAAKDLLRKMIYKDSSRRLTAEQALSKFSIIMYSFWVEIFLDLNLGNCLLSLIMKKENVMLWKLYVFNGLI